MMDCWIPFKGQEAGCFETKQEFDAFLNEDTDQLAVCMEVVGSEIRGTSNEVKSYLRKLPTLFNLSFWRERDRKKGAEGGPRKLQALDAFFTEMVAALRGCSKPAEKLMAMASAAQKELGGVIESMIKCSDEQELLRFL